MIVRRLVLGPLDTNCWIVMDDVGGPAVVIDPAAGAEEILSAVEDRSVSAIVLTHSHFDHIGAAEELVATTGAPLMVHTADANSLSDPEGTGASHFGFDVAALQPDRVLADRDVFASGAVSFQVLHTPGHTPGGICLLARTNTAQASREPAHLFSGDTLFAGSVGRSDLAGGDARALARSISVKLAFLPEDTIVHPGHGPDTTIGRERRLNPFFPRARSAPSEQAGA